MVRLRRISASWPISSLRIAAPRRSPAMNACCAPASPMRATSGTSTARRGLGIPRGRAAGPRHVPCEAWLAGASGCGGRGNASPKRSPRWWALGPGGLGARRGTVGQGGPGHRHGRRVPRAARRDGTLLRPARRRGPSGGGCHPRPLRATRTSRYGPPPRMCRSRWRWRTSWTCWWGSSRSASGRAVPATPMRCAARRWESSVSSVRTNSGSAGCRSCEDGRGRR